MECKVIEKNDSNVLKEEKKTKAIPYGKEQIEEEGTLLITSSSGSNISINEGKSSPTSIDTNDVDIDVGIDIDQGHHQHNEINEYHKIVQLEDSVEEVQHTHSSSLDDTTTKEEQVKPSQFKILLSLLKDVQILMITFTLFSANGTIAMVEVCISNKEQQYIYRSTLNTIYN